MSHAPASGDTRKGSARLFYALALGISWAGWIPFAASHLGLVAVQVPWEIPLLAQFGPSIAALALVGRERGRAGIRALLGRACRWRLAGRWYALALFTPPAIAAVSLGVHAALGDPVPGWDAFRNWHLPYSESFGTGGVYALETTPPPSIGVISLLRELVQTSPMFALVNFIAFSLLTGPVSEEFGWRGYLLPRLQAKRSALEASLLVGLLWGFWHTGPDFWSLLLQGDVRAFLYPLAMTVGTLPLAILSTWLFNNTDSSLLPPMLFHASFNATLTILGLVWTARSILLIGAELVAGTWAVAVIVILVYGPARLART